MSGEGTPRAKEITSVPGRTLISVESCEGARPVGDDQLPAHVSRLLAEFRVRHLARDAGVADRDVAPAELLDGGGNEGIDLLARRDVDLDDERAPPGPLDRIAHRLHVVRIAAKPAEDDIRTGCCE